MPLACATVYDEILKWSKSRPDWQRDVLRRLMIAGSLGPKDIDELTLLCKTSFSLADSSQHKLAAIPLDESHICHDAESGKAVCLTGISDVSNVNAIVSPNPLSFSESGITLIYGDNGAGKSGYVRILKSICRSKRTEPRIFQNVFTGDETQVPSATISFKLGGADGTFPWEKGKQGPSDLTCINVFDSGCGSVYVNEENKIVYMPLGLDMFDKLAKACDTIKEKLQAEKEKIVSSLDRLPFEYLETVSGKWYSALKWNTPPEEVVKNTSFSPEQEKRLTELHSALFEDSKKKRAAELRMRKERYGRLLARVTAIRANLSEEAILKLKDAKVSFETASEAAKLASNEAFGKEEFKGIGGSAWRELWEAAKRFSENEAYPGRQFPYTEPDSKCVLCLQDLKPEAADRMQRFRKFVQDEAASKEARTRLAYENEKKAFGNILVAELGDRTLLEELRIDNKPVGENVSEYLETTERRKAAALKACDDGKWEEIPGFSDIPPEEQLRDLCAQLESAAKALEQADDPELLPKLQAEYAELSVRKWVSERKKDIEQEIARLTVVALYEAAISDTHTGQITHTSTILTDKYVTKELQDGFLTHLKAIYGDELKVSLEKTEGTKGATYYCIKLNKPKIQEASVTEVISEGEFHAVALAAFLAEISLSPTKSGIVFDDPVSSLDHEIRESLAEQLVKLAKGRQIIIFTHDLFFFVAIREFGKKEHVPLIERHVAKDSTGPGMCYPEAPWDALDVSKRITELNKLTKEAEQKYKQGLPEYEKIAGFVSERIRKTVERAIEEILLCDIVHRYRRILRAQNIRQLEKLRLDDLKLLDGLMTRYSAQLHDQAEESKVKLPSPQKLNEDVQTLDKWVREYRGRKQPVI